MSNDLKSYFQSYGEAFDNPEKTATFYGDFAVASTPSFVGCLKGRDEIKDSFQKIADYQKQTGMKTLAPAKVEVTKIDDLHDWAKVQWNATFEKTGDKVISFEVSYLLRKDPPTPKILLYISHQDEMEMRKELGVD